MELVNTIDTNSNDNTNSNINQVKLYLQSFLLIFRDNFVAKDNTIALDRESDSEILNIANTGLSEAIHIGVLDYYLDHLWLAVLQGKIDTQEVRALTRVAISKTINTLDQILSIPSLNANSLFQYITKVYGDKVVHTQRDQKPYQVVVLASKEMPLLFLMEISNSSTKPKLLLLTKSSTSLNSDIERREVDKLVNCILVWLWRDLFN